MITAADPRRGGAHGFDFYAGVLQLSHPLINVCSAARRRLCRRASEGEAVAIAAAPARRPEDGGHVPEFGLARRQPADLAQHAVRIPTLLITTWRAARLATSRRQADGQITQSSCP